MFVGVSLRVAQRQWANVYVTVCWFVLRVLADMRASLSLRPFPLLCVREGAWRVFACAKHLCVRAFVSGCAAMSSVTGNKCTEIRGSCMFRKVILSNPPTLCTRAQAFASPFGTGVLWWLFWFRTVVWSFSKKSRRVFQRSKAE